MGSICVSSEPEIMWRFYAKDSSQPIARNGHTNMHTPKYYCLSMVSERHIKLTDLCWFGHND